MGQLTARLGNGEQEGGSPPQQALLGALGLRSENQLSPDTARPGSQEEEPTVAVLKPRQCGGGVWALAQAAQEGPVGAGKA